MTDGYAQMLNWGIFSVDEIREICGLNPLPDSLGEAYIIPLNAGGSQ